MRQNGGDCRDAVRLYIILPFIVARINAIIDSHYFSSLFNSSAISSNGHHFVISLSL